MTYREQVHGLKKEYTVGNIRVDGHIIKAIDRACALSIQEGRRLQREEDVEAVLKACEKNEIAQTDELLMYLASVSPTV